MANRLNPSIVQYLSKKLNKTEGTIKKDISMLKGQHSSCTSNAVAHIYALKHGKSILGKLDKEDKASLPHIEVDKSKIKLERKKIHPKKTIVRLIDYTSGDFFIQGHIDELNKAYTYGVYTAVYILARKIIENLILDVLRNKYPESIKENKELYYDIVRKRYLDFSVILKNLFAKRHDFKSDKVKVIESLYGKALKLKDDANDKTHSWYHLVRVKSEIEQLNLPTIFELIKKVEEKEDEGRIEST